MNRPITIAAATLALLIPAPVAAAAWVVEGGTYGFTGCSVTVEDVRILEPGGPLVSVGNTQIDHRDCVDPVHG